MSKKHFSNKQLQELIDSELIWPKASKTYRKPMLEEIERYRKAKNPTEYLEQTGVDVVHESLWWDCCELINTLAQMVLDEREKTNLIMADLQQELIYILKNIPKKRQLYISWDKRN